MRSEKHSKLRWKHLNSLNFETSKKTFGITFNPYFPSDSSSPPAPHLSVEHGSHAYLFKILLLYFPYQVERSYL